jgi:hypothetical protein
MAFDGPYMLIDILVGRYLSQTSISDLYSDDNAVYCNGGEGHLNDR